MYMLLEKHLFKVNINCLKRYLNSTRNFRGRLLQLLIDLPATNISTQCLPLLRKSVASSPRQTISNLSHQSNWSGIFPNKVDTTQKSVTFVKKLLTVSLSNITYIRYSLIIAHYCILTNISSPSLYCFSLDQCSLKTPTSRRV